MIDSFSGNDYRFLSNFYVHPVLFEGITYPSTEAAYQASKTLDLNERVKLSKMTPGQSKQAGQTLRLREDWESVKMQVMYDLNRRKFEDPNLRRKLLATGDQELIEGNKWHDNIWGSCVCEKCGNKGKNLLGKTLMKIRGEIRNGWI